MIDTGEYKPVKIKMIQTTAPVMNKAKPTPKKVKLMPDEMKV